MFVYFFLHVRNQLFAFGCTLVCACAFTLLRSAIGPFIFPPPFFFALLKETCFRTADILPTKDADVVADFENFWGSKATLRALPDGSLRTGVVWDCKPHQRHLIVKWIALHVLARHAGLGAERVAMQPFYFEPLLAGAGVPSEAAARAAAEARRMRRRAERAARRGAAAMMTTTTMMMMMKMMMTRKRRTRPRLRPAAQTTMA